VDYATEQGLFRLGDQRWPSPAEMQVLTDVVDPFSYAATLLGFHIKNVVHTFGAHSLDCVLLERTPLATRNPTQYCLDPGGSALRYSRGSGWFQTTYNDIVTFQGRNLARDVVVTDGGKPFLKLNVKVIETISHIDEKDFVPPTDAVRLGGKPLSGVFPKTVKLAFPEWPMSLRGQHFLVTVNIVIGKDGHVVSAHAISGPPKAYKAAEKTARKWIYQPYLIMGEPTEVETKIEMNQY
ncbi:MAG: energy transducer TonB, partial [Acidobacteriaceae bacterium]